MPDTNKHSGPILVINSGSSSLKAALFVREGAGDEERSILEASATGIGQTEGKLVIKDAEGKRRAEDTHNYQTQVEALKKVAEALAQHHQELNEDDQEPDTTPVAIGHRIVHGGMHLTRHQPLTPAVLSALEQAVHFAPLHIPGSLELIRKSEELYPGVPQFACFDTAFHQTLPETAWHLPIPSEYTDAGVRRYGFHGLSYESIVAQLRREGPPLPRRIVVAHLGSGSSVAAIANGKSVDTSMGFTPTGGIPMATRTGDLDPGVLIALQRPGLSPAGALSVDKLEEVLNHNSGLRALSNGISDMQQLEEAANSSDLQAKKSAALAIAIFATGVAKTIASYIISLGGLDLVVFTGGIGEHSAAFRQAVVERLQSLGIRLAPAANQQHAGTISSPGSNVMVRILPAQEDLQIARHARAMLTGS
jgi:acetate kinase